MAKPSELIELLLKICGHGCRIYIVYDSHFTRDKQIVDEARKYFPRYMFEAYCDHSCSFSINVGKINAPKLVKLSYCKSKKNDYAFLYHNPHFTISESKNSKHYQYNQSNIEQLIHYLYISEITRPTQQQIETYRKKLWNSMYIDCFGGQSGMLYLSVCDKYLISDVKKLIIKHILIMGNWNNLGFSL